MPGAPRHGTRATQEGEDLSSDLEAIRAANDAPGLVALAVQDGEVVAWGAAGVRAAGQAAPITLDDAVHLGSCSKAITATLAATLVRDEKLRFETTIAEALPEFSKRIDASYHDVTIEELLRHQGGIAERRRDDVAAFHGPLSAMEGEAYEVREAILEQVLSLPRSPSAAGTFDYSNFGYMTAGLMMERVTGQTWSELMRERVFTPLGLKSALTGSPAGAAAAVGHEREGDAWNALPPGPGGVLPDAMGPAGLVSMTLGDWAKFVGEHMRGARDEDGLVPAKLFQRMHVDDGTNYAAGWAVTNMSWSWGEGRVLTHNGSDGTWMSVVHALPDWDLIVLTAANCAGPQGEQATEQAIERMFQELGLRD